MRRLNGGLFTLAFALLAITQTTGCSYAQLCRHYPARRSLIASGVTINSQTSTKLKQRDAKRRSLLRHDNKVSLPHSRYMTGRSPWLIVLLYAAFSTLWIVVAGYLISLTLDDPVLRGNAYLAKELVLVAISSGLFYMLLKLGWNKPVPSAVAGSDTGSVPLNRLMLMFFSLV